MATHTDDIIKETSEMFNNKVYYTATKLNYIKNIEKYFEKTEVNKVHWTRETIKEKINEIKESKKIKNTANADYDIALLNGEEILILTGTTTQVLPYEDYFDVFIDLHHQYNHLKISEMFQKLNDQYVIDERMLSIFMSACNACTKPDTNANLFNQLIHVDILGMCHKPDNGCKYILIYIEEATNFVLLRPLLNADVTEVATELYKIFTDVGPPLAIKATNLDLFMGVMQILKKTPVKYDISIYGQEDIHKMSSTCIFELEKWLAFYSSYNWAFGCYIVQYIMNSRGEENAKSKVYGRRKDIDLNIPYESQSNINLDNSDNVANELGHGDTATNSSSSLNKTNLNREEDIGKDLIIQNDDGTVMEDIEDKIDCNFISNTLQKLPDACCVCAKKGLSKQVICSVCKRSVHLICAERFPLPKYESTHSKVVCSKC